MLLVKDIKFFLREIIFMKKIEKSDRVLLKGARVWWGQDRFEIMDLGIESGRIVAAGMLNARDFEQIEDLSGLSIFPGVIDTQVHFREPGKIHKEDLESGSKAALLGGVTAFFEMPNTTPATTTLKLFNEKLLLAHERSHVDYAFYAGATQNNGNELKAMMATPGCCGIKIFMGSSTGDLLVHQDEYLEKIFAELSGPFAIHAEDEQRLIERRGTIDFSEGVHAHEKWRDELAALMATKRAVGFAEKYKRWVHILHVSTQEEIEYLATHKQYCTVELTPQHLTLISPDCYQKLGTRAQMNPPIRGRRHHEALWKALRAGVVDIIGSDHAPHTLEEKSQPVDRSPSGMPGVQTLLPIMLNHVAQGNLSLKQLVDLLCLNPARLFGLQNRGALEIGQDANLTIVDLQKEVVLTDQMMASKVGWSPFDGMRVRGFPVRVYLRGVCAMRDGEILRPSQGKPLVSIPSKNLIKL